MVFLNTLIVSATMVFLILAWGIEMATETSVAQPSPDQPPSRRHSTQFQLLAYDCAEPTNVRDWTFEVPGSCREPKANITAKEESFQILVEEDFQRIPVWSCSLVTGQQSSYCGDHDHVTIHDRGPWTFEHKVEVVSKKSCWQMIKEKKVHYANTLRREGDTRIGATEKWDVNVPGKTYLDLQVVGSTSLDDSHHLDCVGDTWSNPYLTGYTKTFGRAIVRRNFAIEIKKEELQIPSDHTQPLIWNKATLPPECHKSQGFCEVDGLVLVWEVPSSDYCTLARGKSFTGLRVTDEEAQVVMSNDGNLVRLVLSPMEIKCQTPVFGTNHEGIFIFIRPGTDSHKNTPVKINRSLHPAETEIFTFVANRDQRLFKDMTKYVTSEFRAVLENDCLHRHRAERVYSWMASIDTKLVAWLAANGTFADITGEAIVYYDCQPVQVYPAYPEDTKTCYEDLEVYVPGSKEGEGVYMFAERLTRKLTAVGVESECVGSQFIPKYKSLNNGWFTVNQNIIPTTAPQGRTPIEPAWDPKDRVPTTDYSRGGVFSKSDLKKLQHYMQFGQLKKAISNRLVLQFDRTAASAGYISPTSLFPDTDSWQSIADGSILGGFFTFVAKWTEFTSFVLSIWCTYKMFVWAVTFMYRVKVLRPLYGLLHGCFWALVPTAFLFKENQKARQRDLVEVEELGEREKNEESSGTLKRSGSVRRSWRENWRDWIRPASDSAANQRYSDLRKQAQALSLNNTFSDPMQDTRRHEASGEGDVPLVDLQSIPPYRGQHHPLATAPYSNLAGGQR